MNPFFMYDYEEYGNTIYQFKTAYEKTMLANTNQLSHNIFQAHETNKNIHWWVKHLNCEQGYNCKWV